MLRSSSCLASRLVFQPLGDLRVTDYSYRPSSSPQRSFAMICTPMSRAVYCRSRGAQLDGARDVPVPRVGTEHRSHHPQRVRGNDPQGFRQPRSLPHLYLPIDEEVNATIHCQPLRRHTVSTIHRHPNRYAPPKPSMVYMTPPTTPDTPSPSYSPSTSPVSSASPLTPSGIEDFTHKIVSALSSPGLAKAEAPVVHSKSKMFTFVSPAVL